jgi:hypothetical protein
LVASTSSLSETLYPYRPTQTRCSLSQNNAAFTNMASSIVNAESTKDGSKKDHDKDLSQILSTEERVELTLLIAKITEVMEKQIKDTFDASIPSGAEAHKVHQTPDKNPNVDMSQPHKETEEEEKTREMREKREKELSAPKMLELKKEALGFFEKWRESVISRVGAVVNKPKDAVDERMQNSSVEAPPEVAPADPKTICMETSNIFSFFMELS